MHIENGHKNDISIIGIACRFPGADNYRQFWDNLASGKNSIENIPADRWNEETIGKSIPKWAGLLNDIWSFDNYYFKITPKEAIQIDPQQRILLEEVAHCIDDSGIPLDVLRKHKTAVFVGAMTSDFMIMGIEDNYPVDQYSCLGNYHSLLANRVSYAFGFSGESIAIDAACASSLVALHNARMNLLNGESDFAIVAGVNIICSPWKHQSFSTAGMLSPEGQCKTFDYKADGYVPGEGIGVVILARKDIAGHFGANIYGYVKGSAVNHNGTVRTITAPSVSAQAEVVTEAIRQSGIDTASIGYIEAHGTGTSLGDPIEVEALSKIFADFVNTNRYIGSVKTNIGHLEAAAGIAGVIKVCMMFKHKAIPPSLNVVKDNPIINFSDSFLKPCPRLLPWNVVDAPLAAGISSFGFGGANSHVVLEEYIDSEIKEDEKGKAAKPFLFSLSAHSQTVLSNLITSWHKHIADDITNNSLADYCFTLQNRQSEKYRFGVVVNDISSLRKELNKFDINTISGSHSSIMLVLNELAPELKYDNIALSLKNVSKQFGDVYDEFIHQIEHHTVNISLTKSHRSKLAHFCLLYALANTIKNSGIDISCLSGSGIGFIANACLAELISLEEAVTAVVNDSKSINIHPVKVKFPFFVSGTNGFITPFAQLKQYWSSLIAKAIPSKGISKIYIEKARLLYGQQGTFTNTINRWFSAVEVYGVDVKSILKSTSSDEIKQQELLCLLIGIRLALDEINNRWDLSYNFEDKSTLPELVSFLNASIFSIEELLQYIVNGNSENILQECLQNNWSKVDVSKYPLLFKTIVKSSNENVTNIAIPDRVVNKGLFNDLKHLVIGGQEDLYHENNNEYIAEISNESYLNLILNLWQWGAPLKWNDFINNTGKIINDLPAYPFDKHIYRYSGNDNIITIKDKAVFAASTTNNHTTTVKPDLQTPADSNNNNNNNNTQSLRSGFVSLFSSLVENITGIPASRINESTSFSELGLDSMIILKLNENLGNTFGQLPVTLFFQNRDVKGLTDYFINNYSSILENKFTSTGDTIEEKSTINDKAYDLKSEDIKLEQNNNTTYANDIAIVGISGKYPGAKNIEELWQLLKKGNNSITEIPGNRWRFEDYIDNQQTPGSVNAKWGGFLDDIDKFDPGAFGISPREARFMSPQERLFLEEAYLCLDNAGYIKKLKKERGGENNIGVFVGASYNDYQLYSQNQQYNNDWVPANAQSYSVANKVSYHFDFHGPSIVVDTACSSSLYAIHLACESLKSGECELALAGGVNTSLHPSKYQMLAAYHFLSSDGKCRAFGEGGDGYVPSEGVGTILLKPLSKAVEEGDSIYGIIKGTSVSHGGKTHGYSVPNPNEQARAIAGAIKKAGIDPRTITYVEAHGTGTSLGDPIEISGLTQAYQKYTKDKQFCAIGSIKSNIGHAEAAAGIAQVTKVVLQMRSGMLVPTLLHSDKLNVKIPFTETPFYVQRKLSDWVTTNMPRRAGISSFGAGGVNVHIILEEYNSPLLKNLPVQTDNDSEYIIGLSADSIEQIFILAQSIEEFVSRHLNGEQFLNDFNIERLSATLLNHREEKNIRIAFTAIDLNEVVVKLQQLRSASDPKNWIDKKIYFSGTEGLRWFTTTASKEDKLLVNTLIETSGIPALAKLWVMGAPINWESLFTYFKLPAVYLPPYPFLKQHMWYPSSSAIANGIANGLKVVSLTKVEEIDNSKLDATAQSLIPNTYNEEQSFLAELADNPESVRLTMIRDQLKDSLAILLGHSSGKDVKSDVGFFDLGVDSLQLTSLQASIKAIYNINIPETAFFEYATVNKLSEKIVSTIDFNKQVQKRQTVSKPVVSDSTIVKPLINERSKIEEYSLDEIEDLDVLSLKTLLEQETKGI